MLRFLNILRWSHYVRAAWWRWAVPTQLRWLGVEFDPTTRFLGMPILSKEHGSRIHLGARAVLCSDPRYTALGVNHPVILRTLRPGAVIEIGEDTGISGGVICAATQVTIGKGCLVGANVAIMDTDFHPIKAEGRRYNGDLQAVASRSVRIGNNVFLGTDVMVLKGVTIGDNTVVGAGSVVVADIPGNVVAVGNPARVVGTID